MAIGLCLKSNLIRVNSIGFCKVGTLYRPFCFRQPSLSTVFFDLPFLIHCFYYCSQTARYSLSQKRPLLALYNAYLETPTLISKIQKAPVRVLTGALIQALILVLKTRLKKLRLDHRMKLLEAVCLGTSRNQPNMCLLTLLEQVQTYRYLESVCLDRRMYLARPLSR